MNEPYPSFTLIVPTYNESGIIADTLAELSTAFDQEPNLDWHIIVVDNASSDDTATITENIKNPRISALRLAEKGRGRAVRAGFRAAHPGIVAFTDVDLSVTPLELVTAYKTVANDECDVLIGTRFANKDNSSGRSFVRMLSSQIFLILAKVIVGTKVTDTQCPLKMTAPHTREVMLSTEDNTWFNDLEFVAYAERLGLRLKELPIAWEEGRYPDRRSKVKLFKDGMNAVKAMLKIRRELPGRITRLREKLQSHQTA